MLATANDPWRINSIPNTGDIVAVEIVRDCGKIYLCRTPGGLELTLLKSELSWLSLAPPKSSLVGTQQTLMIYELESAHRIIRGSLCRLQKDPWPALAKRFPRGTKLTGKVVKTTPQFVHVDIGDGIVGGVPKCRMKAAGFEYASYQQSVVPGQGLDVVINEVRVNDRIITLDLQRNLPETANRRKKSAGRK